MSLLFDRLIYVEIGKPGTTGKLYKDLRVKFTVEKTVDSIPNKATVSIFNLTAANRAFAEQKDIQLKLFAGYDGKAELLFVGDIDPSASKTELQGADYVTIFECGDGQTTYRKTKFDKSYAEGTPLKEIAKDLFSSLGNTVTDISSLPEGTLLNGMSLSGLAKFHLDTIMVKLGLDWSIQNGQIQVTKKNGGVTVEQAVLLTPSTGLIGVPKRKGEGIEVTSLLQPQLKPGRKIEVRSRFAEGVYSVQSVSHTGDNFGSEFYSIMEAVSVR